MIDKKDDVQAIRELFTAMSLAWAQGNGKAYSEIFTPDADYVTFFGQHLKGRKEIAESHQALWDGPLRGSRLSAGPNDIQLRFITSELAIAHVTGAVILRWQKKAQASRNSINTNVLVKQDGAWKIAAFHNCRIKKLNWLTRRMFQPRFKSSAE
ncbi:SgcJ/EcaC family oxidoreductase [Cohnella zeiphila]|uniref:SgcJ/EcaC family oxidoreductase n=1 Tax=Cohnella zeiphila TaxID=2761120 RepID=A0A7X0STI9_9BACL|nr:SgcJ/EcaC family oxidoreductase [Cohnella zeiphila]MBB6734879.1 SgcJ/EcaC family oxidoreductase [Cohnella zeiphila]